METVLFEISPQVVPASLPSARLWAVNSCAASVSVNAPASLRSLVHHAGWVEHDLPLEQVQRVFAERQVEYLALVRHGVVTGLCSRMRLGILFGTRYGFALHSRGPAHLAQVDRPLVFSIQTPAREVLDRSLARARDEFHDDIALVNEEHALIGLVPIDALARLQTRLVSEQVAELQRSREELLAANNALRQSQGRYAGLFDSPAIGVALLDAHGRVEANNARLAELLNLGPGASTLVALAPWIAESERAGFLAVLAAVPHQRVVAREFTFQLPGRGARQFRCSIGWIEVTRQIVVCVDDITEQRAMERQMLRQEKQVLLDTLVGGIAHELNNKLTPVQGFSELIAQASDGQTRSFADLIGRSVAEAAHIIRQLLQLSKPSASVTQPVDLCEVVDEALCMLRFQIREAGCAVRTSYPACPVWVQVDPAEIKQVVINLALNAVQATAGSRNGDVELAIVEADGEARLIVADNGVGIPAENLGRIFDPFFTTKGPERGSGLGLSVCFGIVRQHGGRIDVASEAGAGARFTVSLPSFEHPGQALPAVTQQPLLRPTARAQAGLRVLVVEDEPQVRRYLQTVLATKFGCDVDTVSHGVEAFERLAVHTYALVISDLRMPTMNGTELYLWLREAQPQTAERFIFVTGYPGDNQLVPNIAECRVPVLTKPFTIAQLADVCAPYLQAASGMALAG